MSQEQVNDLISHRGRIKAKLTRFGNFINNFEYVGSSDIVKLQIRFNEAENILADYNRVQDELESALFRLELVDEEANNAERDEFESRYFDFVSKAKSLIECNSGSNNSNNCISNLSMPVFSSNDLKLSIKLPEIKISEFHGGYKDWSHFFDTFKSLIHDNPNLDNVQKFHYLNGALKGEAAKVISSFKISSDNYEIAIQLLKDRFENKKAIINSHLKAILFELPAVKFNSSTSLRNCLDTFLKHFRSLENLGENVHDWNSILICLLTSKIDYRLKAEWEASVKNKTTIKIENLTEFLNEKCIFWESLDNSNRNSEVKSFHVSENKYSNCPVCNKNHPLYFCDKFKNLSVNDRYVEVKRLRYCTNCLRPGHSSSVCKSNGCKTCNKHHNSLLHGLNLTRGNEPSTSNVNKSSRDSDAVSYTNNQQKENTHNVLLSTNNNHCSSESSVENIQNFTISNQGNFESKYVLLPTALVIVHDRNNEPIICRTFLDSCSQANLISGSLLKRLGIKCANNHTPLAGVDGIKTKTSKRVKLNIHSMHSALKLNLNFFVVNTVTQNAPNQSFNIDNMKIPDNIKLADPKFNESSEVDMLIGAGVFYSLHCVGQISLGKELPILQKTQLGWVVAGSVANMRSLTKSCFLTLADLDSHLQKFWNIEEIPSNGKNNYSLEESECEEHFISTTQRNESGRFIVNLPLKNNVSDLGESRDIAIKRFHLMEHRLQKNSVLCNQYCQFMQEYINLGHMSLINEEEIINPSSTTYYMSHHSVEKLDSTTTRIRVVFNASMRTTTGLSLNDVLKVGPVIQNDLFTILIQFRRHNFVLIGDIAKMYRQALVCPEQCNLQRIVWRSNPNQELEHYTLNTVTYGTAPASFLATRCLLQISTDVSQKFPIEGNIIKNEFYVDDLLTGAENTQDLITIRKNLTDIFSSYGFQLRKFMSNDPNILSDLQQNDEVDNFIVSDGDTVKTLGITWNANLDSFIYRSIQPTNKSAPVTKRSILSYISKQFDPLGLLAPITIRCKLIMQALWQVKVGWDESLPLELNSQWKTLLKQLLQIDQIVIPRHVFLSNTQKIELHGFADASEKAYGACVYIITQNNNANRQSRLLCAKSRVAPLKVISLPRLELCGTVLLASLINRCSQILNIPLPKAYCYTDSTIVLSWLSREPNTLKTFVANRTSKILRTTKIENWYHVKSSQNPADLITRGSTPAELKSSSVWWNGPEFLVDQSSRSLYVDSVTKYSSNVELLEERTKVNVVALVCTETFDIFERSSSLLKLQRIMAYCLRFLHNTKSGVQKLIGKLSCEEIDHSIQVLIRLVQSEAFSHELKLLKLGKNVLPNSKLSCLSPFINKDGIICVGGRLNHSELSYSSKHPVALPAKHQFTNLLINHEHVRSLHSGVQNTLSHVRQNYWPLQGRQVTKSLIRKCVTCFKAKPVNMCQQMGQLPASRVTPARIFASCGIDYAGPFELKETKCRNRKLLKSYICIFICLASKACHIEVVSELTTEGFLASLKRFVSRRGLPTDLYSDNASNFVGAHKVLVNEFEKLAQSNECHTYLLNSRIKWHFIPPRSPHFGGIWESSIKSIKTHLKRVMNKNPLTFEEFYTLLTQVEAVLNSRPLTPISPDPNDLEAITPGHFIIGQPLTAVPELPLETVTVNHLKRFQLIQRMIQSLWSRWRLEYLHNLQERHKWKFKVNDGSLVGALVLLKEENVPSQHWPMGRITSVHPGEDGGIRVVTVLTSSGLFKRAINKVCLLPIDK